MFVLTEMTCNVIKLFEYENWSQCCQPSQVCVMHFILEQQTGEECDMVKVGGMSL